MNHFRELRKKAGYTQKQLADMLFVNQTAVSQWERGATVPSHATLFALCDLYNTTVDYLLGRGESGTQLIREDNGNPYFAGPRKGVKIPVLGRVAAGIPLDAVEDIVDYEEITPELAATGEFFGLSIQGDSMAPRICSGDVVIVRRQPEVENGEVAVVLINGQDATVKRFYATDQGVKLVAANPAYDPLYFSKDEVKTLPVEVLGKVVELRGKFE